MNKKDIELVVDALTCLYEEWYIYDVEDDPPDRKEYTKNRREHILRLRAQLRKEYHIPKPNGGDF